MLSMERVLLIISKSIMGNPFKLLLFEQTMCLLTELTSLELIGLANMVTHSWTNNLTLSILASTEALTASTRVN